MRKAWIGTSGWTFDGWRGPFYPEYVPEKEWLAWYASQFATTEINGSFYRTPSLVWQTNAVPQRHRTAADRFGR